MERRGSFCTSELPCFVEKLDDFFDISRAPNQAGASMRRTRSSDPALPGYVPIDGTAEKRKEKKGKGKAKTKKKSKNSTKNRNKNKDKEVEDHNDGDTVETMSVQSDGDKHPDAVAATENKGKEPSPPPYASIVEDEFPTDATETQSDSKLAAGPGLSDKTSLKDRILAALNASSDSDHAAFDQDPRRRRRLSEGHIDNQRNVRKAVPDASSIMVQSGGKENVHSAAGNASAAKRSVADGNHTADHFVSLVDDSSVETIHDHADEEKDENSTRIVHNGTTPVCRTHGRALCVFNPDCCVHKPMSDCECSPRQSCCCVHHNGDCCSCLSTGKAASTRSEVESNNIRVTKKAGDGVAAEGNAETLSSYFLGLLEKGDLCDFQIRLKSTNEAFHTVILPVHRAIIARSRFIATLLQSQIYQDGKYEIVAVLGDQINMIQGFEYALRNLYGSPLLQGEQLRSAALAVLGYTEESLTMCPFPISAAMADLAFSYATSGAFLQVNSILEAGVRMALNLIGWDTVEAIFHFGLRTERFSVVLESAATSNVAGVSQGSQGKADKVPTRSQELQDIWAPLLVRAALTFIVDHIDAQFVLDPQAQSKSIPNRIPEHLQSVSGAICSNPGLAKLKFGSVGERKPGRETVIPSAMLISLPYAQLKEAFKTLNARRVLSSALVQAVVVEREARRLQALREFARQGNKPEQEAPRDIKELGYQEFFVSKGVYSETQSSATVSMEITLDREWSGLVVPEAR
ncbi:hypothetical protein BO71DRAFT_342276 [Aspergillus ellipticus CBS 707.79]|uniref:BTB domain-containing protein n=1 Tax=Aspergillus ellipticus CBS 707.79 TaxID=1448320 RepID=A0A319DZJ2_9EURO|nr:hypothetical protein BO71DRAFT_342276 [Aspergillus ellipticus CBS 707.79]